MNFASSLNRETWLGALYATLAYGAWGLMPVYWKWVGAVPPLQMVAHRVLWSIPVLLALVGLLGRSRDLTRALTSRADLQPLLATAALISANWLIFIWAIQAGFVLNASLGYYINPLLNIVLGLLFLGERLRPVQGIAVLLAGVAVLNLTVALGVMPWISLALALTFGFYGLLRKTARVDGLVGLTVETLLLAPLALGWLLWVDARGEGAFLRQDPALDLLIPLAGLVTALPLLWFANAARRLRYATVGFFQYLAPTGQFLLAVLVYQETFTPAHGVTFGLIWLALGLYSFDSLRALRSAPAPATPRS